MTVRRVLECNECKERVLTRTAIGHANYQEFAFPCPKCRIEVRFGMTLDQQNPEVKYTLLKNAAWRDDMHDASHERKFDTETLMSIDPDETMMPILHAPFLAKDMEASMQRHGERYHAMQEFWPRLEKMAVHQQNRNRALFAKVAIELGYDEPIKTDHDMLMTMLHGFDAYGSIFACDAGAARTQVGKLTGAARRATTGRAELIAFFEAEHRWVQLWNQLMSLRRVWASKVCPIILPVFRAFDWDPAKASLAEYTLSQKRFEELRPFFVDAFETLCRISVIAAGMECVAKRGRLAIPLSKRDMPLAEFEGLANGAKPDILRNLDIGPLFVPFIDAKLRNGIGHHSAHYRVELDDIYYQNQSGSTIERFSIGYMQFCEKLIRLYAQVEACAPLVGVLRANVRDDVLPLI
ncbi:MAG: hypothetical protein ACOZE5_17190 [Verrucomicrobiota bacterium]